MVVTMESPTVIASIVENSGKELVDVVLETYSSNPDILCSEEDGAALIPPAAATLLECHASNDKSTRAVRLLLTILIGSILLLTATRGETNASKSLRDGKNDVELVMVTSLYAEMKNGCLSSNECMSVLVLYRYAEVS